MKKVICIDPGHGMSNVRPNVYDPGATSAGVTEAEIVMHWANELRAILMDCGHRVIRTRVNAKDPAPVALRAQIARQYNCDVMLSLHCNAANGAANGTETFYRGAANQEFAKAINDAVVKALGTRDRGIKTEAQSQHSRLAVLNFPRCCLLEIGFIDNEADRQKMLDPLLRKRAYEAIAGVLMA